MRGAWTALNCSRKGRAADIVSDPPPRCAQRCSSKPGGGLCVACHAFLCGELAMIPELRAMAL